MIRPLLRCRFSTKFDLFHNNPIPANKRRLVPTSGIYPKGFKVGSIRAGIKPPDSSQPDLVLVASEIPASGAAVFTKNEFCAASVTMSRELVRRTQGQGIRGVIANSGCANTLTGQAGLDDAWAMSREAHRHLVNSPLETARHDPSVLVMHTGAGAQRLPIKNILQSIPPLFQSLGNSHTHWLNAARGLCTTDTFPKLTSRRFSLPSAPETEFSLAGLTKGAGMVHPNMATTLGILCTDAPVTPPALQQLLRNAADETYNCVSIDGDTSTNDIVAMLANGAAAAKGTSPIDLHGGSSSDQSPDFVAFQRILSEFMAEMAQLVVRDAEGASKFITIRVRGSPSHAAGKHIASVIAKSVLVKTGIYGQDANWHGILAAVGYALLETPFEGQGIIVPEQTSVSFVNASSRGELVKFFERGVPVPVHAGLVKQIMEAEDVETVIDLRDDGSCTSAARQEGEAVYWTSDITHDFVSINSGIH
ncbi:hypothetical protein PhCBS80983_g01762 [Powellomyces hirtus]|uniref:Arginine biosynthesis bifunctional protein ArgJ, mitochondrial n=1 Tax=Powellomyces hirtus TaxID=109895 RepID=A0A507E8Z1_9FUNG|nr:hypothetical protein PhCBS80983_g01762 [Powellomyces hirtus]